MITVHHLENSRSQRVLWLLELLELDYQVKRYKRDPKTNLAPKDLLKVSPLGKSPVIEVDGITIYESGAIFEFLLDHYDSEFRLHPKRDSIHHKDHIFWLHFAEGSVMPPLVIKYLFTKTNEKVPFFMKPLTKLIFGAIDKAYLGKTLKGIFDFIEDKLKESDYLLGKELSAADVMMSFPLEAAMSGRLSEKDYPNIKSFVEKIHKLESYKSAISKGGEYDFA